MVCVCGGGGVGEPHEGRIGGSPFLRRPHGVRTSSKTLWKPPSTASRCWVFRHASSRDGTRFFSARAPPETQINGRKHISKEHNNKRGSFRYNNAHVRRLTYRGRRLFQALPIKSPRRSTSCYETLHDCRYCIKIKIISIGWIRKI